MHRRRLRGGALVLCAGGPCRCARRTIEDERISARQAQHRSREWDSSPAVGRGTGLVASKASTPIREPSSHPRNADRKIRGSAMGLRWPRNPTSRLAVASAVLLVMKKTGLGERVSSPLNNERGAGRNGISTTAF